LFAESKESEDITITYLTSFGVKEVNGISGFYVLFVPKVAFAKNA